MFSPRGALNNDAIVSPMLRPTLSTPKSRSWRDPKFKVNEGFVGAVCQGAEPEI